MAKIPEKFMGLLGKFVDSLDYNDLPKGWADNPEIVQAAGELYRDMGTESPFFKAWFGKSKVVDDAGNPKVFTHATEGKLADDLSVEAPFSEFKIPKGGTYFRDATSGTPDEETFGGMFPYTYEVFSNPQNLLDATNPARGQKGKIDKTVRDSFDKQDRADIKAMLDVTSWNPVESFKNGDLYADAGRDAQNRVIENLRTSFDADGIYFPDNQSWATGDKSLVMFNPSQIKATSNRGTFNPDDPNIYRAIPFAAGGAGAAALVPGEASASVPAEQYRWPADEPGYVNREPGLVTPLVDVADLATAPIGAATAAGRAASVAAEPFIAYGMDKAGNWLGDKVNGLLGYFGWGE